MTDDTINRQDAIKAIEEMGFQKTSTVKAILCRLERLPSAQPERWIPVSERLPNMCVSVIVSIHDDSGDSPWDYTSEGWITPGKNWVVDNDINWDVVAWMPLPRPWKGKRES